MIEPKEPSVEFLEMNGFDATADKVTKNILYELSINNLMIIDAYSQNSCQKKAEEIIFSEIAKLRNLLE